jgi:hypothetical protein
MDDVEQLEAAFRARATSSASAKLDVLMDLERLRDSRIAPFLITVLQDEDELVEVRAHVLKRLRNGALAGQHRGAIAAALMQVVADSRSTELRVNAALALGEFAEVEGVIESVSEVALNADEALDLRYSAFTVLERVGPTPDCVELLRRMSTDETLGRSASGLLSTWQVA